MERSLLFAAGGGAVSTAAALVVTLTGAQCGAAANSKASADREPDLAAQLRRLRLGELKTRAEGEGIADADIVAALDAGDPREALVALVAARTLRGGEEDLRLRMSELRMGALHQRAAAEDIGREELASALDSDDPKGALIVLLVEAAARRGQGGAADVEAEPEPDSSETKELRRELQAMRTAALRSRALAEGVDADAVEEALDADNPKMVLINLLLSHAASRGPSEIILAGLESGGETSVDMLSGVLESALELLEGVASASPRKVRRPLRNTIDRVENLLNEMNAAWCDGVSRCNGRDLRLACDMLVRVRGLTSKSTAAEASALMTDVLDCLDRCGSSVVQSVSVLQEGDTSSDDRVVALECLRGLPAERRSTASADEVCAFEAVVALLGSGLVREESISACMALLNLIFRIGLPVQCAQVELWQLAGSISVSSISRLAAATSDTVEQRCTCAAYALCGLVLFEHVAKTLPEQLPDLATQRSHSKGCMEGVRNALTTDLVVAIAETMLSSRILSEGDVLMAAGCSVLLNIGFRFCALPLAFFDDVRTGA
eukprot:COSAG06_NODE_385_length_16466_cov_2.440582_9_plen_550_part_00